MIKRNRLFLITMVVIIAIAIFLLLIPDEKSVISDKEISDRENSDRELIFGDHFISYEIYSGEKLAINIFGVEKVRTGQKTLEKAVQSVQLDNDNINSVVDTVDTSKKQYKGYNLFNIILQVDTTSKGHSEMAEKLTITFDNGVERTYDIGHLTIQHGDKVSLDLEPKGDYAVGYTRPQLYAELYNMSEFDIKLNAVKDITGTLLHNFDEEVVIPAKTNQLVQVDKISFKKEYDFYMITPVLEYTKNEEVDNYTMPGVLYGITLPDEQRVNLILDK